MICDLVNKMSKCSSCKFNMELTADEKQVRCKAKSWLASWRNARRDKCKQYKEKVTNGANIM